MPSALVPKINLLRFEKNQPVDLSPQTSHVELVGQFNFSEATTR